MVTDFVDQDVRDDVAERDFRVAPFVQDRAAIQVDDVRLARRGVAFLLLGDADTLEIRTRSIVPIPNKYVGLFLSQPEGVTPRYYFETMLPVIEADGMGQTCMPLTHFCQVAITRPAAGAASTIQVIAPLAPARHVPLLTQASAILHHHLPALNSRGGGESICNRW